MFDQVEGKEKEKKGWLTLKMIHSQMVAQSIEHDGLNVLVVHSLHR